MALKNIINGHVNEILDKNNELHENRISICKECPLFSKQWFGYICNNNLWINPETNDVIDYEDEGYTRGCGCRLEAKTRDIESECPINKW